jgi:hypothetical protein
MRRYSSWAAALGLLLALVGVLPAQEIVLPAQEIQLQVQRSDHFPHVLRPGQSPEGFGNIARLQAALAEQKAGEARTAKTITLAPQINASHGGIFGLLAAACEAADEASGQTCGLKTCNEKACSEEACCEEACGDEKCCDETCSEEKCCDETCEAIDVELTDCATPECPAGHCADHGCAASCPSACSLHKCPTATTTISLPAGLEALLGPSSAKPRATIRATVRATARISDGAAQSVCQTKSCARITSANASCCCKDGEDCGCQSDTAAVPAPPEDVVEDKTWQLFQAAEHLEAAGLTVHAKEIREHAQRERQASREALLNSKRAELAKLQAEIDALARSLATPPQVMVNVTVLEMPIAKLRSLGLDIGAMVRHAQDDAVLGAEAKANTDHAVTVGVFDQDCDLLELVATLEKCKLAKRIAEPSLMTMSGRPATVLLGGEFPTVVPEYPTAWTADGRPKSKVEYCEFGTRVNICPVVIGDNELQLQISPRVSELTKVKSSPDSEQVVNNLRIRFDAQSTALMKPGQTLVLLAMPAKDQSDEPGMILLATPSLVKAGEMGQVAPAAYTPYTATLPINHPTPDSAPFFPGSVQYFEAPPAPTTETTEAAK